MASRFGRKKRAAMRAEIQRLHDIGHQLAHENVALSGAAIKHAQAYNALAERVANWDAEVRHWVGEFSTLRLSPGVLVTKQPPEMLHQWALYPPVSAVGVGDPEAISAEEAYGHVERLLHVLIDVSAENRLGFERLVSMRIVGPEPGQTQKDWRYGISERVLGDAKRFGMHQINYLAGQIAEQFRLRMVKEMGR